MGLDTSHDCWHGAYSAFTTFRNELAKAAGYEITVHEYENGFKSPGPVLDYDRFTPENYQGEWAETPEDPLIVLLVHSDCDGVIRPAQAAALADRLEALLPAIAALHDEQRMSDGAVITKTADGGLHVERRPGHIHARGGMVKCTEKFIAGLRAAVAAGEDVDFH